LVVVNALAESPWGTFTVGFTIPLALFMGLYMYRFRKGKITEATIIGVIGLLFAVYLGGRVADSSWAATFTLSPHKVTLLMAGYGFIASVLPVWMLLCPRDYLSSYLKIGTVAVLIIGVILVHPTLQMPAITPFVSGGGPVVPGKVYPFVFITIACGAISGFHALVSSGTTPKMIAKESDARMIGYGSMLMEGVVGVVALIAQLRCSRVTTLRSIHSKRPTPKKQSTCGWLTIIASRVSTFSRRKSIDCNRNQARRICAAGRAAR
jgi:carbon starvation protein